MAHCGDTDTFAGVHEGADHVCAGERFPGAGWALDGHEAGVEVRRPITDRGVVADEDAVAGSLAGKELW